MTTTAAPITAHRCRDCGAPVENVGGLWVDAREGDSYDWCQSAADVEGEGYEAKGHRPEVNPDAPRGGWIVASDAYPGAWGRGSTEAEALDHWRRNGGRGARIVLLVDSAYVLPWVDVFGRVQATAVPQWHDVPRSQRPPVIAAGWRVSTNGRRSVLDLDA